MTHFALSAVGADRPGIVAGVTGVLHELGCNLEDTSMTILRGHFAMMLVVAGPDGLTAEQLEAALAGTAGELDLVVAARTIADDVPAGRPGEDWVVSVYGADRPGIVHRITSILADHHVNIIDLSTRVIGSADRPVYAMVLEVAIPEGTDPSRLTGALEQAASELGVEVSLHPDDADIL